MIVKSIHLNHQLFKTLLAFFIRGQSIEIIDKKHARGGLSRLAENMAYHIPSSLARFTIFEQIVFIHWKFKVFDGQGAGVNISKHLNECRNRQRDEGYNVLPSRGLHKHRSICASM